MSTPIVPAEVVSANPWAQRMAEIAVFCAATSSDPKFTACIKGYFAFAFNPQQPKSVTQLTTELGITKEQVMEHIQVVFAEIGASPTVRSAIVSAMTASGEIEVKFPNKPSFIMSVPGMSRLRRLHNAS